MCLLCQKKVQWTLGQLLLPSYLRQPICPACRALFTRISSPHCPLCCRPGKAEVCGDCCHWQKCYPKWQWQHHALYCYDEAMQAYFHQFKILGDQRLAAVFASEIKQALPQADLLIPIPLSRDRLQQRGFNQVTAWLELAKIPYVKGLSKAEMTPQSHKNRQERLATPQPFELCLSPEKITGKDILLLDDIYTTGRTLFHAMEILQRYHPQSIKSISLAR